MIFQAALSVKKKQKPASIYSFFAHDKSSEFWKHALSCQEEDLILILKLILIFIINHMLTIYNIELNIDCFRWIRKLWKQFQKWTNQLVLAINNVYGKTDRPQLLTIDCSQEHERNKMMAKTPKLKLSCSRGRRSKDHT